MQQSESVWVRFYEESKKPYSSVEEFASYCENYASYTFQAPHIQDFLERAKTLEEFLYMVASFEKKS